MQVYIYAAEGKYQGARGINWCGVVDVDSLEEVDEYGYENAIWLFSAYSHCFDEEDIVEADVYWEAYKIRSDINMSTNELDAIAAENDKESFIEEYCEKEMWG